MWYVANILLKSLNSEASNDDGIWEERFVLFEASNETEAAEKATSFGESEQHSYLNDAGETISWKFDSIERIEHLDASKFEDKLELFSRFLRKSEVESLKKKFESEAV
jgi:hypothetical protein